MLWVGWVVRVCIMGLPEISWTETEVPTGADIWQAPCETVIVTVRSCVEATDVGTSRDAMNETIPWLFWME